jgi:hypothetical protein
MPAKTLIVSEHDLRSVALPQHGNKYAVISHGYIIDKISQELYMAGLQIQSATYKATMDQQVAQGTLKLTHSTDKDMGMMFAWCNSYNKQLRFKCAVGASVFVCMNGVISSDMMTYSRKHSGSALYDVESNIIHQIANAKQHYNELVQDKEILKDVILTPSEKGTILGRLFAEQEILTLTQTGIVKREMDKPSFNYNCHPDSAWAMYNHITLSLKESHPLTYLSDHQKVHSFFIDQYGQLNTGIQKPVQILKPVVQESVQDLVQVVIEPVSAKEIYGVTFM